VAAQFLEWGTRGPSYVTNRTGRDFTPHREVLPGHPYLILSVHWRLKLAAAVRCLALEKVLNQFNIGRQVF
jgi:hypothetical protein